MRTKIRQYMLQYHFNNNPSITIINTNILHSLFKCYDKLFFSQELSNIIKERKEHINFKIIQSKNRVGYYSYKYNKHVIGISNIITNLFNKGENVLKSNGVILYDRLDVMMNILEHEITHLYCQLKGYTNKIKSGKGKMYYSSHGKLFQELVYRYFGHTDFKHNLLSGDATKLLCKNKCYIGMNVFFISNKNKKYGTITKLNKRTAIIDCGKIKYIVSYGLLNKVNINN